MGLQGEGESSKFKVWRASLRLGGLLEERVTACHGVSGGGQLPAHVRGLGYERVTSVSPPLPPRALHVQSSYMPAQPLNWIPSSILK